MLAELRIRNFAVLRDAALGLAPGLNVISGETGAGKSVAVDALEVLLGGRASAAMVRSGEERGVVEGVVDIDGIDRIARLLEELGLEADDGHLILRREIRAGGRSRAWASGSPATAAVLRRIGSHLVDIHGQHQHQRLLSGDFQQHVLDAFGECGEIASRAAAAHRSTRDAEARLDALQQRRGELESRADFVRFRLGEIKAARLRPREDEELRAESRRLAGADQLRQGTLALQALLHDDPGSVADRLAEAAARVRRLAETDPALAPHADALDEAYHGVADVAAELRSYGEGLDHDPARLEQLHERQALLQTLLRKYGPTLADVIAVGEALASELSELDAAEFDVAALRKEIAALRAEWETIADELSQRRKIVAERLAGEAQAAFAGLGLDGGAFRVDLERLPAPDPRGRERVRFLASMNPGFPPAPLAAIASGGELSRVMLALKSILAGIDELPVLVFDEIDAGVGGIVAGQVAARLEQVAAGRQVVAVTHLARIAARADRHFVAEKRTVAGAAETSIRRLEPSERVREIARMLGGDPDSETSLNHARKLLGK